MSRLELAWWVLFWASGAVALLRWPGRTLGLVSAVMAWTAVGPWAAGVSFAATVVGAVAWRLSMGGRGVGLVARPRWAACALAAAATVLAPGWWVAPALVALVVSGWWLMAAEVLRPRSPVRWRPSLVGRARRAPSTVGDAVAEQTDVLVAEIEDFLSSGGGAERGAA
jgi:hypothetical protein